MPAATVLPAFGDYDVTRPFLILDDRVEPLAPTRHFARWSSVEARDVVCPLNQSRKFS